MNDWFTIDRIDADTYIINEYRHWEETHCYLLSGSKCSLLIDTCLGICNIYDEVKELTDKPITAVATLISWDHIGDHKYFPHFYAHRDELNWLNGEFPLSMEQIKDMVIDRCKLPQGYDVNEYEFFQGPPTRVSFYRRLGLQRHAVCILSFHRSGSVSYIFRKSLGIAGKVCVPSTSHFEHSA